MPDTREDTSKPASAQNHTTVVITAWDSYCEFLGESVPSALQQEGAEVIVVDNASDVAFPELDATVTVVRAPTRLSAGSARNFGLSHVRTPLVLFLDADDVLLPGSVQMLKETLEQNTGALAAVGKRVLWDPESGKKQLSRSPKSTARRVSRNQSLFAILTLFLDVYQLTGCTLLQTAAARDAGGFGDASLAEDWMLRSALAFRGKVIFTSEPASLFRVREGSLWNRSHSRPQLEEMYKTFRAQRLADPKLTHFAHWLMPLVAGVHRLQAKRMTRQRDYHPSDQGLRSSRS